MVPIIVGITAVVDSIKVSIFCTIGLKMLIYAPQMDFLAFDQQNRVQYKHDAQKAHLCVETSYMMCRSSKTVKQLLRYIVIHHFLPRDSYAKRSICRRRVSVCVSVCHTPVLYQNG